VRYRETGELATALIEQAIGQQPITPSILHADRGAPMRSKHVSELLDDLGVSKTHSRPYTSSDNPYSEANFKTLKYRPAFPAGSTRSSTHAGTAARSRTGTTTSTATPGSR
jgi:putative transposase